MFRERGGALLRFWGAEGDPGEFFFGEDVSVWRIAFWVVETAEGDVDERFSLGVPVGECASAVGAEGALGGGFGVVGFGGALGVSKI